MNSLLFQFACLCVSVCSLHSTMGDAGLQETESWPRRAPPGRGASGRAEGTREQLQVKGTRPWRGAAPGTQTVSPSHRSQPRIALNFQTQADDCLAGLEP